MMHDAWLATLGHNITHFSEAPSHVSQEFIYTFILSSMAIAINLVQIVISPVYAPS